MITYYKWWFPIAIASQCGDALQAYEPEVSHSYHQDSYQGYQGYQGYPGETQGYQGEAYQSYPAYPEGYQAGWADQQLGSR